MDLDMAIRVIDQYASDVPNGDVTLHSTGEPLLNPVAFDVIEYIATKGLGVRLTSSGQPIDSPEKIAFLAENVKVLNLSIEGVDKRSYEASRAGAQFEHIIWVLEQLRGKIEQGSALDLGIYTLINTNRSEMDISRRIVSFYERYECYTKRIQFRALGNQGSNSNMTYADSVHGLDRCRCLSPFQFLQVRWNGKVSYCCAEVTGDGDIGDAQYDRLERLWHSPRIEAIRLQFENDAYDELPRKCQTCSSSFAKTGQFESRAREVIDTYLMKRRSRL